MTSVTDKLRVTSTRSAQRRSSIFTPHHPSLYDHHPSWRSGDRANLSSRSRLGLILRCSPASAWESLPSPQDSQDSVPAFWRLSRQDSQVFPDFSRNQRVMDNSRLDIRLNSWGSHSNPPNFNNRCRLASQVNSDNKGLPRPFLQSPHSFSSNKAHSNPPNQTGSSAHLLARAWVAT